MRIVLPLFSWDGYWPPSGWGEHGCLAVVVAPSFFGGVPAQDGYPFHEVIPRIDWAGRIGHHPDAVRWHFIERQSPVGARKLGIAALDFFMS